MTELVESDFRQTLSLNPLAIPSSQIIRTNGKQLKISEMHKKLNAKEWWHIGVESDTKLLNFHD